MPYVFGPVPSRRLGMSLGVDLIPPKTCTYDCLYCQVGRTTKKSITTELFSPTGKVIEELQLKLKTSSPDTITLAGSGEPTLHSGIKEVIDSIRLVTDIRIAVLTNGSCFWKNEIRNRVLGADIILPTLTSATEETFRLIHRPHPHIKNEEVIRGLIKLREDFAGLIHLEVVLLSGINDSEEEMKKLKSVIEKISPDKVQLNTVIRPPADPIAIPVDNLRMKEIKNFFGKKAEIVTESRRKPHESKRYALEEEIVNIVKRRPLRSVDISNALGVSLSNVEDITAALSLKGRISKREHSGEIFYLSSKKDAFQGNYDE
jgi:wyosine [tRNA(Phe)-imidazoG37] synthetase (radical SAM superfamily)